jgi:hypothetical protein
MLDYLLFLKVNLMPNSLAAVKKAPVDEKDEVHNLAQEVTESV